jgi:hypothetical protein
MTSARKVIESELALHSAKYHTIFVKAHVEPDPRTGITTLHVELPVEAIRAISPNGQPCHAILGCFRAAAGDIWETLCGPNATVVGTKEERIDDIAEMIRARWEDARGDK